MNYLKIMKRNLIIFLVVIILSLTISLLINNFLLKPIYRGSCVINSTYIYRYEISKIEYLYSTDEVKNIIQEESFLYNLYKKTNINYNQIKRNLMVRTPAKSDFVIVIYECENQDQIKIVLNEIINLLRSKDNDYDNYIRTLNENIENRQKELEKINSKIKEVLLQIENLEKNQKNKIENYIEYSILWSVYDGLLTKYYKLFNEIDEIKKSLSLSHDFEFITPPSILDKPVKPNKMLNVLYSTILSVILTFIILVLYDKIKRSQF